MGRTCQHLRFLAAGGSGWVVAIGETSSPAGGDLRRRGHVADPGSDHLGLVWVLAGRGRYRDAQHDVALAAGDALWRLPGVAHRNSSDPAQPWHELWLSLPPGLLPALRAAGLAAWPAPVARIGEDPALARRWGRLLDLAGTMPSQGGDRLLAPFLDLALEVVRRRGGSPEAAAVAEAQRLLAEDHRGERRVADIAAASGIGYHRLRRLFPRLTGRSLVRWRIEQRLERACGELLAGERTVAEVAIRLGWPSAQAFCRQFAGILGESPGAWRRRMGRGR